MVALGYFGLHTVKLDRDSAPAHVCRVHSDILLHALLGLLRASRQLGQQFHRSQRESRHWSTRERSTSTDVGSTITIQPTQEQLGFSNGGRIFTIDQLATMRDANTDQSADLRLTGPCRPTTSAWSIAERNQEIPASWFQSINPFTSWFWGWCLPALWGYFGQTGTEPGTPIKFALGLLQLGLGFGAFWYGAHVGRRSRHGRARRGYSSDIYCRQLASSAFRPLACR